MRWRMFGLDGHPEIPKAFVKKLGFEQKISMASLSVFPMLISPTI
jgi:hypothetical protein